jgi:hypothetical protein
MLTNTRSMLEVAPLRADVGEDRLAQLFRRVSRRAGQISCGITGHNVLLHYQPTRLSLQCATCGYESPGWELERTHEPQPY